MKDQWEKELSCAISCHRCDAKMAASDKRILSVYRPPAHLSVL
jgi:hypothetical protein